jgi:adenylate/nucleoside-diphosphate kinase
MLAKKLNEKTGMIHLHISKVVTEFMDKDSVQCDTLRRLTKDEGRALDDDMLVNLLYKRIQMTDVFRNGFILEDFPKTRNQSVMLARKGIAPSAVFCMRGPTELAY